MTGPTSDTKIITGIARPNRITSKIRIVRVDTTVVEVYTRPEALDVTVVEPSALERERAARGRRLVGEQAGEVHARALLAVVRAVAKSNPEGPKSFRISVRAAG